MLMPIFQLYMKFVLLEDARSGRGADKFTLWCRIGSFFGHDASNVIRRRFLCKVGERFGSPKERHFCIAVTYPMSF